MKIRKVMFLALFFSFLMALTSCQGMIEGMFGDSDDDGDNGRSGSTKSLTITVSNYTQVISGTPSASSRSARTIAGSTTSISDELEFYVYGSATDGSSLAPTRVYVTTPTGGNGYSGVVTLNISSANWYLTLAAIKGGDSASSVADVEANAVLAGRANVDLRTGSEVTFTLSVDGLKKEGAVTLTLKPLGNWWKDIQGAEAYTIKAGIYDRVEDSDVTSDGKGSGTKTIQEIESDKFSDGYSYALTTMAPGTYLFKVAFENSTNGRTFYWSDIIKIYPGQSLVQNVDIPNIIGTTPKAPTAFFAQYKGSEKGMATYADMSQYLNRYVADFNWTDESNNEKYFEIDIAELADKFEESNLSSMSDTSWFTSGVTTYNAASYWTTTAGNVIRFQSDSTNPSSLLSGSQHAEFLLELGKRYYARIRAVNDAGESAYTYLDLTHAAADGYLPFASSVNLFRIKYDLNGGTFYSGGSASTSGVNYIREYYTRDAENGISIVDISNAQYDATAANKCGNGNPTVVNKKKDGIATGWLWLNSDKSKPWDKEESYKGFANLNLKAVGSTSQVVVINGDDYKILTNWISISTTKVNESSATAVELEESSNTTQATAETVVGDTKVSFKLPADSKWKYNYVKISIDNTDRTNIAVTTSNPITLGEAVEVSAILDSGVYTISIVGTYGTVTNSYSINLTVKN